MSLHLADACAAFVLDNGPLNVDQLHALAVEQGLTRARGSTGLRTALARDARFVVRPDGRHDTAARLLTGAVLTTRLRRTPDDGVLWVTGDLDPLLALTSLDRLPLASGGELRRGLGQAESWCGPDGWLAGVPQSALLGLRWTGRELTVEVVEAAVAADSPHAQDVRRVLARHAGAGRPHDWALDPPALTRTVLSALVEDPDLLRAPLPPLSELLPLPEHVRPQDYWGGADENPPTAVLRVPVPEHVAVELARRADLIGERLPGYAAMLLGAAADRRQPVPRRWAEPAWPHDPLGEVVDLHRWSR